MTWQPIETAPRDGTALILWDDRVVIGSWRTDEYKEARGEMWLDFSHDEYSLSFASCPLNPTHWIPLPEPPK